MDRKDRVGRIFLDKKGEMEQSINSERKERKIEKKSCFLIDSILNQSQPEGDQEEGGELLNVVESDREDNDEDLEDEEYEQSNSRSMDHDELLFPLLRRDDQESRNEQAAYPVLKPLPIYSALQIPPNTSHFLPTVSSAGHSGTIMQQLQ